MSETTIYQHNKLQNIIITKKGPEGEILACKVKEGIKTIGPFAFNNWDQLEELTLPDGLEDIQGVAFKNCSSLKSVVFPTSLKTIGVQAFANCSSLENITFPTALEIIYSAAFGNCKNLKTVIFNDGLKFIGAEAFEGCTSLKEVIIPKSVETIEINAFTNCDKDFNANIPNTTSVKKAIDKDNLDELLENIQKDLNGNIVSCNIKAGVTNILSKTFYEWKFLEKIVLPQGLEKIGMQAFAGCISLKDINLPTSLIEIEEEAFVNCISLENINIPRNLNSVEMNAFENCPCANNLRLPKNIEYEIDLRDYNLEFRAENIIRDKSGAIISCKIKEGVTSIGENLETGICSLNDTIYSAGGAAFRKNTSLVQLELPSTLRTICQESFEGCSALKTINLPEGLECIESCAFEACTSLENITLPMSLTELSEDAFYDCEPTLKITLPLNWEKNSVICDWLYDCTLGDTIKFNCLKEYIINGAIENKPEVQKMFDKAFQGWNRNTVYDLALEIIEKGGEEILFLLLDNDFANEDSDECEKLINLAKNSNPAAQCALGIMIRYDLSYALETIESWYNGNPYAVFRTNWLEKAVLSGYAPKCSPNELFVVDKYIEYIRKRAKNNFIPAQELLGKCYEFGYGVKKNKRVSNIWYNKAIANKTNN